MSRAIVTINREFDRMRAANWINTAPIGTRVEFKASKRSIPQNDLMWSLLTEIATQVEWHGAKYRASDWKLIFLDALGKENRVAPGIDGGIVSLGVSSSDLSKEEMSDLLELIQAFGAGKGVIFGGDAWQKE
jgi:hypothetical protein